VGGAGRGGQWTVRPTVPKLLVGDAQPFHRVRVSGRLPAPVWCACCGAGMALALSVWGTRALPWVGLCSWFVLLTPSHPSYFPSHRSPSPAATSPQPQSLVLTFSPPPSSHPPPPTHTHLRQIGSILTSNLVAVGAGEWRGSGPAAIRYLCAGLALLVVAIALVGSVGHAMLSSAFTSACGGRLLVTLCGVCGLCPLQRGVSTRAQGLSPCLRRMSGAPTCYLYYHVRKTTFAWFHWWFRLRAQLVRALATQGALGGVAPS
jgi:hypothetical protein